MAEPYQPSPRMQPLSLTLTHPPDRLTPAIQAVCRRLSPTTNPIFVERLPSPDAVINKCTFNVRRFLELNPGEMVLGWDICVWNGVLVECLGHAVVRHEGQYRCVTPSRYPDTRFLFLPDPSLRFNFSDPMARMPSIQLPLSSRPEVARLIEVENLERQIKIAYPVTSAQMAISGADAVRLQQLNRERQRLTLKVILTTSDHNTRCPCGSGKKLRKCHRSDIERSLQLM